MPYMKDADGFRLDDKADTLNILSFGVVRGTASSQTAAIKAALDANPGKAFRFPPGNYRLDTPLVASASNSFDLRGARLYAGAAMATLFDYDPDLPGGQYSEDTWIVGGTFDGNNLADTCVRFAQILRVSFTRFTIKNGIHRGLVTAAGAGAELLAYDGRIHQTGTGNLTDNVAIDNQMGDCHFSNIVIRDWVIGVRDNNGGRWDLIHPWLSGTGIATRYPGSIAFDLTDASNLTNCYADTYCTAFKLNASGGRPRMRNMRAAWNPALTDVVALANQSYVFDNSAGAGAYVYGLDVGGRAVAPTEFLLGTSAKMNVADPVGSGYVNNVRSYYGGVRMGLRTFTPNVFGSTTNGSQTYGTRSGYMTVADGMVTYRFTINVTLGALISGNLRIGGLPFVDGAASVNLGHGPITTAAGVTTAVGLTGANGSGPSDLAAIPLTISGAEISANPLASTALVIRGSITCPFDYAA